MLTRRTFLRSAAVAGAAPLIWQTTPGALAASGRLTLGFIGVGTMGRGHLGGFLNRKDVEVVAVCDVVQERLDSAAATVGKAYANKSGTPGAVKSYGDFRDLLKHKDLDAVVIATPDHWHAMICTQASASGKHIYCEKPLTHNIAEGRALVEAVAKSKVVFQTGSQQRSEFGGNFRKAVELIWNGRIGKLKTIHIGVGDPSRPCDLPTQEIPKGTDWDFWQGPAPERGYHSDLCPKGVHGHFPAWRNYEEYAGGGVADMGAHHFDIAQWAMEMDAGGPVEIVPPSDKAGAKHGLKLVYASGIEMIHNEFPKGKDGKDVKGDCVFVGEDGIIVAGRGELRGIDTDALKTPLDGKAKRVMASSDHKANWLDAIKSLKLATICPAETGHRSASVCHLTNIGYRLHRKLKWDPAKELFVGDDAANKELSRTPRKEWKA